MELMGKETMMFVCGLGPTRLWTKEVMMFVWAGTNSLASQGPLRSGSVAFLALAPRHWGVWFVVDDSLMRT